MRSEWPHNAYLPEQQDDTWTGPGEPGPWSEVLTGGGHSGSGRRCIYDAEGDGILNASHQKKAVTQFWCIAALDVDTGEEFYWGVDLGQDSLKQGVKFLGECEVLLAHHGIGYDYPATERLYPGWVRPAKSWDTLVIAKVIWPMDSLIVPDLKRIKQGKMPGNLFKAHSLKAWGYRTGTFKGEYAGGFDEWCPAMASYLMGDIRGTWALWRLMEKRLGWAKDTPEGALVWPELTIETECAVARIIFEQELRGVRFNVGKAVALAAELANEKARLEKLLIAAFGSWWQPLDDPEEGRAAGASVQRKLNEHPDITIPRISAKTGKALKPYVGPPLEEVTKGSRSVRIEWTTFNPSSRDHLGMRLQAVYGWKPKAFGADKKATVDEGTLEEIPESVLPADLRRNLLDYFVVSKVLGTLSKGQKAWLTMASGPTNAAPWHIPGRIHGQMDTCGAVTRRGTHKNPNLSGCPAVLLEKDEHGVKHPIKGLRGRYGWEMRDLFEADEGWQVTGVDASALELICLGHYLEPLDGGVFSDRVCDPERDPHTEHADLCGMDRAEVKTTTYLKVYGGSAYKLSLSLTVTEAEIPKLLGYKGLPMLLKGLERRFDEDFVRKLDDSQKARIAKARQIILKLEEVIVGLADLTDRLQGNPRKHIVGAAEKGWLKGMDGTKIIVRKPYAALNSLLQSAGAMACKTWMLLLHRELRARGYVDGVDFKQILFIHDELQFTHKPGMGPVIREVANTTILKSGEMLNLKGQFRSDGKTGHTWAETH